MEEQKSKSHVLCLAFTHISCPLQTGPNLQDIEYLLRHTSQYETGRVVIYDVTKIYRDSCFNAFPSWTQQNAKAQVLHWCDMHSVKIFDSVNEMKETSDDGLCTVINASGIEGIFHVRKCQPIWYSWRIGGIWAGTLKTAKNSPQQASVSIREKAIHECPPMPNFSYEWDGFADEALKRAGNSDMIPTGYHEWPIKHNTGPFIKLIKQSDKTLKTELSEPAIQKKFILPGAILLHDGTLLTQKSTKTNLPKIFRGGLSWSELVEKAYLVGLHNNMMTTVIDMVIDTPTQKND